VDHDDFSAEVRWLVAIAQALRGSGLPASAAGPVGSRA
jgi:hypothetical protein